MGIIHGADGGNMDGVNVLCNVQCTSEALGKERWRARVFIGGVVQVGRDGMDIVNADD